MPKKNYYIVVMKYDDLLNVPYLELGRKPEEGLDCYGLVLELSRRNGRPLRELPTLATENVGNLPRFLSEFNVERIKDNEVEEGDILQTEYEGNLHIGYLLDSERVIHATKNGVRITPVSAFRNKKYFRIR